jgi:hypothetical protein
MQIHKSAMIHRSQGRELTVEETRKLIPLDDLFSIFRVVLIAADVIDVGPLVRLAEGFRPEKWILTVASVRSV